MRYADGRQEFWRQFTLPFSTVDRVAATCPFPQGFFDETSYSLTFTASGGSYTPNITVLTHTRAIARTATSAFLECYRQLGETNFAAGDTLKVDVTAVGRWKA